jgi:hypothetical protein
MTMTDQKAKCAKVGDRVRSGARTGIVEFVVSDVFVIKWDGRKDSAAFTREAFEKQFVPHNPAATPARPGSFLISQLPSARPR